MGGPDAGTVRFYAVRTEEVVSRNLLDVCLSHLSPEEIDKAMAFRSERDQVLSITARALIRYLLSLAVKRPARSFVIEADEYGKPVVCPGTPGDGICFNISHTRGMAVCAMATGGPVGVDVEDFGRKADPEVARRFFAKDETAWIKGVDKEGQASRFLEIWTLKEAYIKAEGKGLSMSLDRMAFDLSAPGKIGFSTETGGTGWQFFQLGPARGLVAALAVRDPNPVSLLSYHCLPFDRIWPATGILRRESA